MNIYIATVAIFLSRTTAFAPSTPTLVGRGVVAFSAAAKMTTLFSEPPAKEEEEGGLDLDLSEMFDMFDAADKGKKFDAVIKDVKKEKKN